MDIDTTPRPGIIVDGIPAGTRTGTSLDGNHLIRSANTCHRGGCALDVIVGAVSRLPLALVHAHADDLTICWA